jgi:hypothetical protein
MANGISKARARDIILENRYFPVSDLHEIQSNWVCMAEQQVNESMAVARVDQNGDFSVVPI